jgi:FixJ family two-component response regulator
MPRVVHVVGGCASFQTATEYLLKQAGYAVASYPSGRYFLDHLPNESVRSCILLKVRMPGLIGPELQEHLVAPGPCSPWRRLMLPMD